MTELLLIPIAAPLVAAFVALLFFSFRARVSSVVLGWVLSLAPLSAFALLLSWVPRVASEEKIVYALNWMPSLGLRIVFMLDGLSALFALLVSGIGALIVVYAGYYFQESKSKKSKAESGAPSETHARFFIFLLLFMTAMLALVLAGDVVTLFIFWEGTSITSFFLIAYKYKDETARRGAFKSMFFTGGGGIALLAGLILVSVVAGATDFESILKSGDALRAHAFYPVMLALVALGTFTKSAQFPAHTWLPDAMSAPTPASAYLHSATMVKAGIFLMARLFPALGGTELWFWLLTSFGLATMLVGALLGLRQNDLKGLLAYSTISQLGALMALIGTNIEEGFKALAIGVVAHAFYKGALFLVAGIVDQTTGSRDLRKLGNLRAAMPATFVIATIAGLSMAGLPPLFGFLAKETLLAAAVDLHSSLFIRVLFSIVGVVVGALMLVQAGMLVIETFLDKTTFAANTTRKIACTDDPHAREASVGFLIAPAILSALSVLFALVSMPYLAEFIAAAAKAAFGEKVKVSLALWTGFNLPLLLSAIAIANGAAMLWFRHRLFPRTASQNITAHPRLFEAPFTAALGALDKGGWLATRLQDGTIRRYLLVMLIFAGAMLVWFDALRLPQPRWNFDLPGIELRIFALALSVGAALASVTLKRHLHAILALGASGLAMAMLIALEPSPDVALVQIIVDILTTVVLVMALSKLPRSWIEDIRSPISEKKSHPRSGRQKPNTQYPISNVEWRNLIASIIAGAVMFVICLNALSTRPRESIVTPYYEANSKPLTGANDIVGAIVVDFRGFDTMIEITVFSMAGLAVVTLLVHAAKNHGDFKKTASTDHEETSSHPLASTGIGGLRTSPFVHALAYALLPLALMIGFVHMAYGHDQPGDGFTAGVIIALTIGFWTIVFGYDDVRRRLPWVKPNVMIGAGILTVMTGSIIPTFFGLSFFAPMDFGQMWNLPLPKGFYISTSFLFELSICLVVMGSASYILDALRQPGEVRLEEE
jgi:NADH:ubiquinone oxidoreductase subunit 5 (subunit L)/multisubunit Na+/H+ antiporter MnhA subunit/uncharacterized MnhB-related membrane protein